MAEQGPRRCWRLAAGLASLAALGLFGYAAMRGPRLKNVDVKVREEGGELVLEASFQPEPVWLPGVRGTLRGADCELYYDRGDKRNRTRVASLACTAAAPVAAVGWPSRARVAAEARTRAWDVEALRRGIRDYPTHGGVRRLDPRGGGLFAAFEPCRPAGQAVCVADARARWFGLWETRHAPQLAARFELGLPRGDDPWQPKLNAGFRPGFVEPRLDFKTGSVSARYRTRTKMARNFPMLDQRRARMFRNSGVDLRSLDVRLKGAHAELALRPPVSVPAREPAEPAHVYRVAFGALRWTPTSLEPLDVPMALGCAQRGAAWVDPRSDAAPTARTLVHANHACHAQLASLGVPAADLYHASPGAREGAHTVEATVDGGSFLGRVLGEAHVLEALARPAGRRRLAGGAECMDVEVDEGAVAGELCLNNELGDAAAWGADKFLAFANLTWGRSDSGMVLALGVEDGREQSTLGDFRYDAAVKMRGVGSAFLRKALDVELATASVYGDLAGEDGALTASAAVPVGTNPLRAAGGTDIAVGLHATFEGARGLAHVDRVNGSLSVSRDESEGAAELTTEHSWHLGKQSGTYSGATYAYAQPSVTGLGKGLAVNLPLDFEYGGLASEAGAITADGKLQITDPLTGKSFFAQEYRLGIGASTGDGATLVTVDASIEGDAAGGLAGNVVVEDKGRADGGGVVIRLDTVGPLNASLGDASREVRFTSTLNYDGGAGAFFFADEVAVAKPGTVEWDGEVAAQLHVAGWNPLDAGDGGDLGDVSLRWAADDKSTGGMCRGAKCDASGEFFLEHSGAAFESHLEVYAGGDAYLEVESDGTFGYGSGLDVDADMHVEIKGDKLFDVRATADVSVKGLSSLGLGGLHEGGGDTLKVNMKVKGGTGATLLKTTVLSSPSATSVFDDVSCASDDDCFAGYTCQPSPTRRLGRAYVRERRRQLRGVRDAAERCAVRARVEETSVAWSADFAAPAPPPPLAARRCGGRPRTVASLSSFGARAKDAPRVVRSVLAMDCPPDALYVMLSDAPIYGNTTSHDLDGVAEELRGLGAAVLRSGADFEDRGPATKILPVLERETGPRTRILTVDDDTAYDPRTLAELSARADALDDVGPYGVGFYCDEYGRGADGFEILPARDRRACAGLPLAGTCHGWLSGVSGVLWRRDAFDLRKMGAPADRPGCQLHDDVWLAGHALAAGARLHVVDAGFDSRAVRAFGTERPEASSFVATRRLRQQGVDPISQCAASFDSLAGRFRT